MQLDCDELNARLVTFEARTGVYLNHYRKACVVVRVKEGKIHYLHEPDSSVQLQQVFIDQFLREWIVYLPSYPVRRALRAYSAHISQGFGYSEEAGAVIRAVLKS